MSTPEQEPEAYVLMARGQLEPKQQTLVLGFIELLGLVGRIMTASEYQEALASQKPAVIHHEVVVLGKEHVEDGLYSFTDIRDPEEFLVREHFEDFQDIFNASFGKQTVTRAFHHLLDGASGKSSLREYNPRRTRQPEPLEDIVITTREKLGIPPYDKKPLGDFGKGRVLAAFAIHAGSIVEYAAPSLEHIDNSDLLFENPSSTNDTEKAIVAMALQLRSQFQSK